jgi:hypothetical protein
MIEMKNGDLENYDDNNWWKEWKYINSWEGGWVDGMYNITSIYFCIHLQYESVLCTATKINIDVVNFIIIVNVLQLKNMRIIQKNKK